MKEYRIIRPALQDEPYDWPPFWRKVKAGAKRTIERSRMALIFMDTNFYSIFHGFPAARCASAERQLTVILETTNYGFGRKTILATLKNLLFLLAKTFSSFSFCIKRYFLYVPGLAEDGQFLYLCPCYFPRTLTPRWRTVKAGAKRYMERSRIALLYYKSVIPRFAGEREGSRERRTEFFLKQ